MIFETILPLLLFLFPLAYSPGPGNMFFAANGARFGVRATMPANIGYHLATVIVTIFIGLGFLAVLEQAPALLKGLQVAGSAYVIYLAYKLYRAGTSERVEAKPAGLVSGVMLLLLNPKAYVIIALMFSQFLSNGTVEEIVFISVLFTLNNFVAFLTWTVLGDQIARLFRDDNSAQRLNTGFALILLLVGLWMFFL